MEVSLEALREFGKALILDDKSDIGKFSYEGHPSPFHHWMWGAMLIVIADLSELFYNTSFIFNDLENVDDSDVEKNINE